MHTRTQIPDLTPVDPPISSGKCCLITFSCWPSLYSNPLSGKGQSIESSYHQRHRFQVPLCRGKKAGVGQEEHVQSGDTRWHGSRFLGQKRRCFLGSVWGPVEEPALWASSQWPVLHGLGPICLVELTASPARDKPVVHADDSGVQAVTVPPPARSRTEYLGSDFSRFYSQLFPLALGK